jgi:hypothetical protein
MVPSNSFEGMLGIKHLEIHYVKCNEGCSECDNALECKSCK